MVLCWYDSLSLRWRHNGRHCLLNRLFRCRWKKTSNLRVTGLCAGNSTGTGEFPAQMASNAENVSIWWRHQDPWPNLIADSINLWYSFQVWFGGSVETTRIYSLFDHIIFQLVWLLHHNHVITGRMLHHRDVINERKLHHHHHIINGCQVHQHQAIFAE